MEKHKVHTQKETININNADTEYILISKKYSTKKKRFQCFIANANHSDDDIKHLHIKSSKLIGLIKSFEKVKYMSFILKKSMKMSTKK